MGVDVDAEVMIGMYFNSDDEAKEYIERVFNIKPEEYDNVPCELEFVGDHGLSYQDISGYGDYGGVFGVHVGEDDLSMNTDRLKELWDKVYKAFPEEDHDKLKAHIWARYW